MCSSVIGPRNLCTFATHVVLHALIVFVLECLCCETTGSELSQLATRKEGQLTRWGVYSDYLYWVMNWVLVSVAVSDP